MVTSEAEKFLEPILNELSPIQRESVEWLIGRSKAMDMVHHELEECKYRIEDLQEALDKAWR